MVTIITFKLCISTLFVIMFEGNGTYLHFCIGFTYLLYFKSSIMPAYYNTFFRHICQKDVPMGTFNLWRCAQWCASKNTRFEN